MCVFVLQAIRICEADVYICVYTDSCRTTECVCGDWSSDVKQENLADVKQEPDDVCSVMLYTLCMEKGLSLLLPLDLPNVGQFSEVFDFTLSSEFLTKRH